MKHIDSVVVAIDGESKCGKTTWIDRIATEAEYQADVYTNEAPGYISDPGLRAKLTAWVDTITFAGIYRVTAGNAFRAAAHYVIEQEKAGETISAFGASDVPKLRALLAQDGVHDILQNDEAIERRVSLVAQMSGVRALCETIFCDEVLHAYNVNGGSNLVVADARNPIQIFQRNGAIGEEGPTISSNSILPIYLETSAEVAASRMKGDFEKNLAIVQTRRHNDATRSEYPMEKPTDCIFDLGGWLRQFPHTDTGSEVARPFYINNDEPPLAAVQSWAGGIAAAAHDVAGVLYLSRQSGYVRPDLEAILGSHQA